MKHLAAIALLASACHTVDYSANSTLRSCPANNCAPDETCVQNFCVAADDAGSEPGGEIPAADAGSSPSPIDGGAHTDTGGANAPDLGVGEAGTVSSPEYTLSRQPGVYGDDGELWDGETLYPWANCWASCDWDPSWVAWGPGDDVSIIISLGETPQTIRSFGAYQVCNAWGFDCTPITVATLNGDEWINQGEMSFTEEERLHNANGGETGSFGWARLQLQSDVTTTSVRFMFSGNFAGHRIFSELEIGY